MKRAEVDGFPNPLFDRVGIKFLLFNRGHCRRQAAWSSGTGYKRTDKTVRKERGGREKGEELVAHSRGGQLGIVLYS